MLRDFIGRKIRLVSKDIGRHDSALEDATASVRDGDEESARRS